MSEFEEFLTEQLRDPEVRTAYLASKAMTKDMLHAEASKAWAEIDRLTAELERLRAEVADYREGINWGTTCLNCSSILTSSYHQYVRAEKAERERDEARAVVARVRAFAEMIQRDMVGSAYGSGKRAVAVHVLRLIDKDPS